MIQNEYRLFIPSGSVISEPYHLKPTEYLAGFYTCSDLQGNMTMEEAFIEDGPFRTVYGPDDKQLKWNTLHSGAFHILQYTQQMQTVRFKLGTDQNKLCSVFLRVTEL